MYNTSSLSINLSHNLQLSSAASSQFASNTAVSVKAPSQKALTRIHGHKKLLLGVQQSYFRHRIKPRRSGLKRSLIEEKQWPNLNYFHIWSSIIYRLLALTTNLIICRFLLKFSFKFTIVHSSLCHMQRTI